MNARIGVRVERAYSTPRPTTPMVCLQVSSSPRHWQGTGPGRATGWEGALGAYGVLPYCSTKSLPLVDEVGFQYGHSTTNNTISGLPKATETTVWLTICELSFHRPQPAPWNRLRLGCGGSCKSRLHPARPLGTLPTRAMVAPTDVEVRGGTEHVLVTWCFNEGTPETAEV